VNTDLFFWFLARVAGLSAYAALAIALLTGLSLRLGVLGRLAPGRSLRSLHEFTAVLWMPLGLLHVASLLLDGTARIRPLDLVVPFQVSYGRIALGLGTVSLLLIAAVALTGWLRQRMPAVAWQWTHRLSYAAFGTIFAHAALAGTDFSDPAVSALTWATAAMLALLALARLAWGRLPT
jgi:methionine sulfoxide reductase heme-binding subunit